jgi:hypothetical protein
MPKSSLRIAVLCLLVVGCAGMEYQPTATSDVFTPSALPMYMGSPQSKLKSLIERAPFDFDCPAEEMTYKVMGSSNNVGVIGCGRRATYALVSGVGWVMNTSSEEAPPPTASESPVAPAPEEDPDRLPPPPPE